MPPEFRALLRKQHYALVGVHSAVKPCMWLKKSLRGEGVCYKQRFYGIESHRCMQMTPAVGWCTHRCLFCWRNTEYTLDHDDVQWEEPEEVIEGCLQAHRQAISGFKGSVIVDKRMFEEACKPNQVAVSLAGEPTIYPHLSGLLEGFKRHGMTTYLVSNGTLPKRIESLDALPTNMYVSLVAPDKETYFRTAFPMLPDSWERFNRTLELFPSLDTRTVVRVTSVKGLNMKDPKGYARLISKAEPDFIEVKAYMFVGGSRLRLTMDHMPSHEEVKAFASEIADELSYDVVDEQVESRVVLLKH